MEFRTRLTTFSRYLIITVIGMIILALFFRNSLTSIYLHRKIDRFNQAWGADLKIKDVRIKGLASVQVTGITLKPLSGDTLCKIDTAYASISILKLFAGRIALHDVQLRNPTFTLVRNDPVTNYMFLLKNKKTSSDTAHKTANYAITADRLMGFIFDKIPRSLSISNFRLINLNNHHRTAFQIEKLEIRDHYFHAPVQVQEENSGSVWILAGRLDNENRTASLRIYSDDSAGIRLPFLQYKWKADVRFDTLAFSFGEQETNNEQTRFSGFISVTGLSLNHEKIAAQPVLFEKAAIDYRLNIGSDYLEFDSASTITFNRLVFHPYARYRINPSRQITLKIHKGLFPAMDLFSSIPEGLFSNLSGIKVQGNLSWHLDFYVDLANPDSLQFETSLDRRQFSVISYGNSDLTRLNRSFLYTAYEHDIPVRTFMVGPENPNFRSLNRISRYLQVSVMTSEDGGFYQHRGFLPDAFRESMITNIKEHRFARGGSTISMQLVKNVFLNRNKTIARKLEEALLVWLIENQGLSTKDRMFEVYLNIIEWGPLVYGANEAARFYFNKDASRLTLSESIFLASIIPRPKGFRYSFDETGHLRESNAGFYRLCTEKMVNKGWITSQEAEKAIPDVELKGPANLLLKKQDATSPDTVSL